MSNLQQRTKVHCSNWLTYVVVFHIRYNPHNLKVARALHTGNSKVNANRIFSVWEEFFDEGLIDNRDRS